MSWFFVGAFLFPFLEPYSFATTLDDLKGLEITCFVPSYLPQGLRLKSVEVTYDGEPQFRDVPECAVQYAVNTPFSVFLVQGRYYCCQDGIWCGFTSASST